MENSSNKWFVLAAILALFLMITLILFEVVDKPKIEWNTKLDIESKASGGLHLFKSLLEAKYGQVNVVESDSLAYLEQEQSTLFIHIAPKIIMADSTYQQLIDFVERGNEVLLITSSMRNAYEESMIKKSYSNLDTTLMLYWPDSTEYQYKFYWQDLTRPKNVVLKHIAESYDSLNHYDYEEVLTTQDDNQINYSILIKRHYGEGLLAIHSMPELFTNVTSLQDIYLDNFKKTFNLFESERVILHKRKSYLPADTNTESPIQYILQDASLKSAYYLLLFTAILYAIFAAKRKQKLIPTLTENKNTSLSYVKTMSELYKAQGQNEKLVPHMEKIFSNKIKNKYFIDSHNEEYARLLSLKSKVSEDEINKILLKFDSAKSHKFSDDQIINLYNDIISFHKKSN